MEFKQQTRLEEKRKKALDQHLSFIVDQTEKYSSLVAESMNTSRSASPKHHSDGMISNLCIDNCHPNIYSFRY